MRPSLRWQFCLLVSIVLCLGMLTLVVVTPSRMHCLISNVTTILATLIAVVWIFMARRTVPLRRVRRAWLFIACSVIAVIAAQLMTAIAPTSPLRSTLQIWHFTALFLSYGLLSVALLIRSGKTPQDRLSNSALWWDLLTTLYAASVIIYHFFSAQNPMLGSSPGVAQLTIIGYPLFLLCTLAILSITLFRALPRPLHGPRSLLTLGVLLLLGSGAVSISASSDPHPDMVYNLLSAMGVLCLGVAALWEADLYGQRMQHSRVIDPFPSLFSLLLPIVLGLCGVGVTLFTLLVNAHELSPLFSVIHTLNVGALSLMIAVRQILAFERHRVLYHEVQERYTEMAQHAATDPLTGLANHRYFMDRLHKEMRRASRYKRPLSLIFCDLDFFKQINDSYGHISGDRALRTMADTLRQELRELDIVARYGGEEFVVLMPETTLEQAIVLAERLRIAIENLAVPYRQSGVIRLTMSCGVSAYPDTSDSVESLLSSADHAMYRAKREGRNRVVSASAPLVAQSFAG